MAGTTERAVDNSPGAVARWRGSLSALLPEGWLAEEVIQLRAPDGSISLNVAGGPTPQSIDELVERYGRELAQLPGYREVGLETAVLMGGREGKLRTFTWNAEDGSQVVQLQAYVVEEDSAFVATASASAEVHEVRSDLILGLLQSIETTPRSFEVVSGDGDADGDDALALFLAGLARVDGTDGADLRIDWSETARAWRSEVASADSTAEVDLSAEELEALAQLYGFETFPGIGRDGFSHFSTETKIVAGRAARRSLLAHGVVRIGESGAASVDSTVDSMLRVGLEPRLLVTLERQSRDGRENTILFADPDTLIEHVQLRHGSHRLSSYPASSLFARLTGRLDLRDEGAESDGALQISPEDVFKSIDTGEQISAEAPLRAVTLNLLTITYEEGDGVAGGWVVWFLDDKGHMWRLNAGKDEDPVSPVKAVATTRSELEDEILSYLPGVSS